MATVTVKSVDKMMHVASGHRHTVVVDQPRPSGDDLGMSSTELLLASLGT